MQKKNFILINDTFMLQDASQDAAQLDGNNFQIC